MLGIKEGILVGASVLRLFVRTGRNESLESGKGIGTIAEGNSAWGDNSQEGHREFCRAKIVVCLRTDELCRMLHLASGEGLVFKGGREAVVFVTESAGDCRRHVLRLRGGRRRDLRGTGRCTTRGQRLGGHRGSIRAGGQARELYRVNNTIRSMLNSTVRRSSVPGLVNFLGERRTGKGFFSGTVRGRPITGARRIWYQER